MTEEELERHRKPKRQVRPTDASSQVNCAKKTTGQAIPASLLQLVTFAESAACTSAVPSQSAPVPLKPSSFYPSILHLDSPSTMDQLQIEQDDIEFLLGVWRNRCAVTGDRLGNSLDLVRWDWTKPSTCDNLVLLSGEAMKEYDANGKSFIPDNVVARIERRLASCADPNSDW